MPIHGELVVKYVIFSTGGADISLTRMQALALMEQLRIALKQPAPKKDQ